MVQALNRHGMAALLAAIVFMLAWFAVGVHAKADCRQLLRGRYYYQAPVAVVVPAIYHTTSPALVERAEIRRQVREELDDREKQARALTAPTAGLLTQRCASCHDGNKAFSMAEGLTPLQKWRVVEIFSHKIDVPLGMEGIVAKAQTDGSLPDLLDATVAAPTLSEQPVAKPAPEPGELQ